MEYNILATKNIQIPISTSADIRDAAYWNTPLLTVPERPFNELIFLNNSAVDVDVLLDGDPTKFYTVLANGGILEIVKDDRLFYSYILVTNLSAAAVAAANSITVTMRRVS